MTLAKPISQVKLLAFWLVALLLQNLRETAGKPVALGKYVVGLSSLLFLFATVVLADSNGKGKVSVTEGLGHLFQAIIA